MTSLEHFGSEGDDLHVVLLAEFAGETDRAKYKEYRGHGDSGGMKQAMNSRKNG